MIFVALQVPSAYTHFANCVTLHLLCNIWYASCALHCYGVCLRYFEWHRGQDGKKQPYFFYASCDRETRRAEETCTPVSCHGKTEVGNEGKENMDGERESQPCRLNLLCVSR